MSVAKLPMWLNQDGSSHLSMERLEERQRRVLVIKFGALGDLVQAMGSFSAIRLYHATALIVLLTRKSYAHFMRSSPYFDAVWVDERPRVWQMHSLFSLRAMLRGGRFSRVYDLQTSDRSSCYFWLMGQPVWSGVSRGCAYPHANPNRNSLHSIDRQAEQLAIAGIPVTPAPDLSWVRVDNTRFHNLIQERFVLFVTGGASHRLHKRWPAEHYAALAVRITQGGCTPVFVGRRHDGPQISKITADCPRSVNLFEQTTLADLVGLGRNAVAAVGNDTGPMHLLAASGCPCVVLYGPSSDPSLCAPRGHHVITLRCSHLADLPVAAVEAVLAGFLEGAF